MPPLRTHRKRVLYTLSLLSIAFILIFGIITYLQITSFLKDPLMVSANVTDITGTVTHNETYKATFEISIDNSVLCRASCREYLFDINTGAYQYNRSFSPSASYDEERSFILNTPAYGRGNLAYRYELHCRNPPTAWCPGSGEERIQSVFMSLSYTLTSSEERMVDTIRAEHPRLLGQFNDIITMANDINQSIGAFIDIFGESELSHIRERMDRIHAGIHDIDYSYGQLRQRMSDEDVISAYQTFTRLNRTMEEVQAQAKRLHKQMRGKENRYKDMISLLEGFFIPSDRDMRAFFNSMAASRRTTQYVLLELRMENLIQRISTTSTNISFVNINNTVKRLEILHDEIGELRDRYNVTLNNVTEELCEIRKRGYARTRNIFNETVFQETRDNPCPDVDMLCDDLSHTLTTLRNRTNGNLSSTATCRGEGINSTCTLIRHNNLTLNNSDYQSYMQTYEEALLQGEPFPDLIPPEIFSLRYIFLSDDKFRDDLDKGSQLSCAIASANLTVPTIPSYPPLIMEEERKATYMEFELPEINDECCFYGTCNPCQKGTHSNIPPPILFVHGHLFNKESSPAFSIMAFERMMSDLEPEGYIHAGELDMRTGASDGRIGPFRQPLMFSASYYYITFFDIGIDRIEFRQRDHIENYALRLNEIIRTVQSKTGVQDVVIVGYSMGGLVARSYLDIFGSEDVSMLITIATPHKGIEGIPRHACHITGSSIECSEMTAGSLFLERLNNEVIDIPFHTIGAKGCLMENGVGDGIVTLASAHHPDAVNHTVTSNCTGLLTGGMHQDIIDPEAPPYVIPVLEPILSDYYGNTPDTAP